MWDFAASADRVLGLRRLIRRETVRLVFLTTVAVAVFLATGVLAGRAERLKRADAARWHERGQELLPSAPSEAAIAFRRAVIKDRGERRYTLALAEALARTGNRESAALALEVLRERSPEDPDVNLALARLYRADSDLTRAVRYYYHAIYAPAVTPDRARPLRLELATMLLDAGAVTRATSELLAASIDAPDSRDLRLRLATLFERAGSHTRAAEQYARLLANAPDDVAAIEGAVRTAFELGDYRAVLAHRLPESAAGDVQRLHQVAREIVSRDPLAPRLSAAERRRRTLQTVAYFEERWTSCTGSSGPPPPERPPALIAARAAAQRPSFGRDTEALEAVFTALDEVRRQTERACGQQTDVERALEIIARRYSGPSS